MKRIDVFIADEIFAYKLYKKDKRRLRKYKNLSNHSGFKLSRSLKWKYKLKDNICIAHTKNIAVIAKSKQKVGIDIEELKYRDFDAIMSFCFSDDEIRLVNQSDNKMLKFYEIFTTKEAFIKYKNLDFSYLKSVYFNEILTKMNLFHISTDRFLITLITSK
ncbi:hypothetical protein LMG7974_00171 [Campylobacter majalis]|uniref:4'-phosphopantetheinyl transferase domain-containing protein n=1 Tax=Campylobacter majalis TaxID=2790656 RepID=A0ABM8Q289_9BACT|nr:4'-phosphopantetheinyl transferase superfamily protein [Campylobacter majalis]CAD7286961.1 hypothetical protein LMG7974_00171 [Campylobacter majalis]